MSSKFDTVLEAKYYALSQVKELTDDYNNLILGPAFLFNYLPCLKKLMNLQKNILWVTFFISIIINCDCRNLAKPTNTNTNTQTRNNSTNSQGGIPNLSNTCYMNSILQVLKAFYLNKINEKDDNLAKSIKSLMEVIGEDKEAAKKDAAKAVFNKLKSKFKWVSSVNEQHDAGELITYLFNWMQIPKASTEENLLHPSTKEERPGRAILWDIYQVPITPENQNSIPMQQLFDSSIATETKTCKFRDDDAVNTQVTIFKKFKGLDKLYNNILVLQIIRFKTTGGTKAANGNEIPFNKYKLDNKIQNPMNLMISKDKTIENDRDRNYNLVAFINHIGGTEGGHYICHVKKEGQWVCYNDNLVTNISDVEAEKSAMDSYILFYKAS